MATSEIACKALVMAGLALAGCGSAQARVLCPGPAQPNPGLAALELGSLTASLLGRPAPLPSHEAILKVCQYARVETVDRPAPLGKEGYVLAVNPHSQADLTAGAAHRLLIYVGKAIERPMPAFKREVSWLAQKDELDLTGIDVELRCQRASRKSADATMRVLGQFPKEDVTVAKGQRLDSGLTVPVTRALAFVDCGGDETQRPEDKVSVVTKIFRDPGTTVDIDRGDKTTILVSAGTLAVGWGLARTLPRSPTQPAPKTPGTAASAATVRTRVRHDHDRQKAIDG